MESTNEKKFDEVAIMGFRLKKVLSFLMVIDVFGVAFGSASILWQSFIWHLIGFIGAHKRNSRLLGFYVFISILNLILYIFLALMALTYGPQYDSESSSFFSSSSSEGPASGQISAVRLVRSLFSLGDGGAATGSSSSESSSESLSSDSFPTPSPSTDASPALLIALTIMIWALAFFIAYCKIYSIVLASRMRRTILTAAAAAPVDIESRANEDESETATLTTPAPVEVVYENGEYPVSAFMQPNFIPFPYPYNVQGTPSSIPPQLMYGQQPVYYTYAPMPFNVQQPQNPNPEKQ